MTRARLLRSRRARRLGLLVVATLLVTAGCSSDDDGGSASTTTEFTTTASSQPEAARRDCVAPADLETPLTTPVEGTPSDLTLTSFDGTLIRIHWFPTEGAADEPAPTILMGPGWSLPGDTSTDGAPLFGALGIGLLNDEGYNVLTWDPRGFGESTGTASVNDPQIEGGDVTYLFNWLAAQPEVKLDAQGDPRMGMVGSSYGGGIQLTVASTDCRVDAIVPGLAWHSLETSLYKAETVKEGWATLLVDAAAGGSVDPHVTSAHASGAATGTISEEDITWFRSRGPGASIDLVDIPTLFVQGTVDTLFTLDEAVTNFTSLRERKVPTAMVWFCGGHGTCLTDAGDPERVTQASLAWLDRYVKEDDSVDTGPVLDIVDQDGTRWTGQDWPLPSGPGITSQSSGGTLELVAEGGSGPIETPTGPDPLAGLVSGITPARAENAVDVTVDTGSQEGVVVGAPKLSLSYTGTAPDGPRPTRVFAQLVDEETGTVVGNQVTPIEVILDGTARTTEVDMEMIAQHVRGGQDLTLQIVATTVAYAAPRLGGSITFDSIGLDLVVSEGLTEG